jgi:hypothetical protein
VDKKKTSLNINRKIMQSLKIKAVIDNKTMTEVLEEAIESYVGSTHKGLIDNHDRT